MSMPQTLCSIQILLQLKKTEFQLATHLQLTSYMNQYNPRIWIEVATLPWDIMLSSYYAKFLIILSSSYRFTESAVTFRELMINEVEGNETY
jgi:hypothetical protein